MHPHRLIILGAGFSKPAGLPLAKELMPLILEEAKTRGAALEIVMRDLAHFCHLEELRWGHTLQPEEVDIERFMSYLDIEHYLGLKGSDTWSEDGNKSQLILRFCLAKVIHDFQQRMTSEQWQLYDEFAKRLLPEDRVITFNYDTLLETACERAHTPYRLCTHRYKTVDRNGFGGTLVSNPGEVLICKVHGSIDWFSRDRYDRERTCKRRDPYAVTVPHPVFDHPEKYHPERLVGSPYPKDDPLYHMYRARSLAPLFEEPERVQPTPLIIAPSSAKLIHLKPLADFWYGFNGAGCFNSQLVIIGFSFPPHDEYVMTPFAQAIDMFQHDEQKWKWFEPTCLKLVELQPDETTQSQFKRDRPFIDWKLAEAFWGGFSRDILDQVVVPNTFRKEEFPDVREPDKAARAEVSDEDDKQDFALVTVASCQYNDMEGTCALDWLSGGEFHDLAKDLGIDTDAWFPVAIAIWGVPKPDLHIYLAPQDKSRPGADSISLRAHFGGGRLDVWELVIPVAPAVLLRYIKRFSLLLKNRYAGAIEELRIVGTERLGDSAEVPPEPEAE